MSSRDNFADRLLTRARRHPDRVSLIEPVPGGPAEWTSCTYSELSRRAMAFARGLADAGIGRGDRVLLMIEPSIQSTAVYFGLIAQGAVPVLVDPRMGVRALLDCVSTIEPSVIIGVPRFHALLKVTGRTPPSVRLLVTKGRRWFWAGTRLSHCEIHGAMADTAVSTAAQDPCFIAFTSGSTGRPKAVSFTHRMVAHQADLVGEATGWSEGMKVAMCFAGFIPLCVASGLTTVLPGIDFSRPGRARPERIVEAIEEHRCQSAFASPALWRNVARYCKSTGVRLDSLRCPVTAGAPVPIDLHAMLRGVIQPRGRLQTPYGATEAMPITTTVDVVLDDTWEATRRGSGICVGRPLPGVDVSVVRIADQPIEAWTDELEAPAGEVGEIVVSGSIVTPAYELDPAANLHARILRDGRSYHRTGDLGHVDERGRVWYCGRLSQRVETRGVQIAPARLESILDCHPGVRRTALVGVGPPGDQLPVICVEVEAGGRFTDALPAELERMLDDTPWSGLIHAWLPHRGFPVDARHNSKIRREALARWAAKRLGAVPTERV